MFIDIDYDDKIISNLVFIITNNDLTKKDSFYFNSNINIKEISIILKKKLNEYKIKNIVTLHKKTIKSLKEKFKIKANNNLKFMLVDEILRQEFLYYPLESYSIKNVYKYHLNSQINNFDCSFVRLTTIFEILNSIKFFELNNYINWFDIEMEY